MEVNSNIKTIRLQNGETYAYRESGSANSTTILLLHGAFASSAAFQLCSSQLSNSFHLFAIDFRGHSHSSYNQALASHDDFVTDLKQFTEALNLEEFYLLGWSMGGNIAMKFAAQYPEKVQGLLLISSAGPKGFATYKADTQERARIREEVDTQPGARFVNEVVVKKDREGMRECLENYYFNGKNKPRPEIIEILIEAWLRCRCADILPYNSNNYNISDENNGVNDGTNELSKIKCKLLVLHGEKDVGVPVKEVEYIKEKLGDLVEFKVFEDAGHFVLEDYFDETIELIQKFCLTKKLAEY